VTSQETRYETLLVPALPVLASATAFAADPLVSGDAYARYDAAQTAWTLGTGILEQRLELSAGKLR
jgi:hypothetical protein